MREIHTRPSLQEDLPFVLSLHHQTLKEYIEPIWGWDEKKWDQIISKWFKPERIQILQKDSEDIGILVVEEKENEIFFESISILPELQGQGLGKKIITGVLERAKSKFLPVRLEVLRTNLPAQRLYQNLGFEIYEETPTHFRMRTLSSYLK